MSAISLNQARGSITDKPAAVPTAKDTAEASDLIAARKVLLYSPEMVESLEALAALRPSGHESAWPAAAGLTYHLAVERHAAEVERLFSSAEIDAYAREWRIVKARVDAGAVNVGIGFVAGRAGRGRRMTAVPIELAVRSLAFRLTGLAASAADEGAAEERNTGRDARYWVTASTVAVYRKRLRYRVNDLR